MSGHHPWREIKHKKDASREAREALETIRLGWCVDADEAEPESRTAIHDFHTVFKAYDDLAAELAAAREKLGECQDLLADARNYAASVSDDHAAARTREKELREALPSPDRLREIADILDFFDRVMEMADFFLPGERERYRAADHTQMQDDLRRAAATLESR